LRALGAFSESNFVLHNGHTEILIPSIAGISSSLDAITPFGEYFGLFTPSDALNNRLNGLERLIQTGFIPTNPETLGLDRKY
jgi:hypothetical protein